MKLRLLSLGVAFLRLLYCPFRALPLRSKVTIISRQSDRPSADIRMLAEDLHRREPRVECRVLSRFIQPGIGGKLSYLPHMISQMYHIATSRVVVLDGYCIVASVLRHKPETRILQLWHAICAVKKFGYQTLDLPTGHSRDIARIMCMHRNYDHVLCPSEATGRLYMEAFNITESQLLYMGLPRLDLVCDSQEQRQAFHEEFGIPPQKEILLYVPTFRKGRTVPLEDLIRAVDPERFALVIRLHPLEEPPQLTKEQRAGRQIILDRSYSTQIWLQGCDRVITDYSALSVEASLTDKPVYFYVYDIEEYRKVTGLNVDPEEVMPRATARTALQLQQLLAGDYDREELRRFRDTYVTVETKGCTARLGEYIYGMAEKTL